MEQINQIYTLKRAIQIHGKDAKVLRLGKGPYGSPGELQTVCSVRGLYHTSHNYLLINTQEGGKIPERNSPMLLLLYTEEIQMEDIVEMDGKTYKVTGMDDPGGLHLCIDLSLKEE